MLSDLSLVVSHTLASLIVQQVFVSVVFALLWPIWVVVKMYLLRPENMYLSDKSMLLGSIYSNLKFICLGPQLIEKAYAKAKGMQFAIPALREYQVLVTSKQHIHEVNVANPDDLSFYAAMDDRLRFRHVCAGLTVGQGCVDPLGSVPQKTFKLHLRKNLPDLTGRFQKSILSGFQIAIDGKLSSDGWRSASVLSLAEECSAKLNNQALLGDELASNPDFHRAAVQYSHDCVYSMELARHIPEFCVSTVISWMMKWSGARDVLIPMISSTVQQRLERWKQGATDLPKDCITWAIMSSNGRGQRTVERLTQQLLGFMFASAHQVPMALAYAIFDLCDHPEYIDALREEAEETIERHNGDFSRAMPRLESFLRESARCNPLDALTVQRKALADFHFSDGTHVPRGNLVAVAQKCLLSDPARYPRPDEFDGFRFLKATAAAEEGNEGVTRFTDISLDFPYWGAPKRSCAGRWYASYALKQTLTHLLTTYDFQWVDKTAPRMFTWTTAMVPRRTPRISLRERYAA